MPKPGGLSRNTMIGIAVAVALAIVIGLWVQRNEREFQRARRAAQSPVATGAPAPAPAQSNGAAPAPYGGYNSGGTPGTPGWIRNQLIGRWSAVGCNRSTFEFRADGTTFAAAGSESLTGTWTLQESRVTVVEPNATTVLEIVQIGDEMVTEAQGRQQIWRRCP